MQVHARRGGGKRGRNSAEMLKWAPLSAGGELVGRPQGKGRRLQCGARLQLAEGKG